MNRIFRLLLFLIVFSAICAVPQVDAQEEKTYRIAVLDLQAIGVAETEALALSEKLRSSFSQLIEEGAGKNRYILVERSQMNKILDEFEIQSTGCTDLECAVEFGKMLSVENIVVGSLSLIGETYMIVARIVDIESAKTIRSVDHQYRGRIDDVISLMPIVGRELLTGEKLAVPVSVPSTSFQSAAPVQTPRAEKVQDIEQYISVSGAPEGAEVFLNGEKIGITPFDNHQVAYGGTIRISKVGYEDYIEGIVITPGNNKITYTLIGKGIITIEGIPSEAEVTINGEKAGKSPVKSFDIREGKNRIWIYHPGYKEYINTITISPGSIDSVFYTLEPIIKGRILKKSLIIPGTGQWYAEHQGKGAFIIILQATSVGGVIFTSLNASKKNQLIAVGTATAVYIYNVIDAVMIGRTSKESGNKSSFNIDPVIGMEYAGIAAQIRY